MEKTLECLAENISASQKVVAFSGAGFSAESGIPTFRGSGGLWERYHPSLYGTIPGLLTLFALRPSRLCSFISDALCTFSQAEPHSGHRALVELEHRGHLRSVITQNIDDLHERAGHRNVIKLHGDLYCFRCSRCGTRTSVSRGDLRSWGEVIQGRRPTRTHLVRCVRTLVPRCPSCSGTMRPDVVFFGESLPTEQLSRALVEARECELLLIIGTSGVVFPAASIPYVAKESGALIAEISTEPSAITSITDFFITGPAGRVLPELSMRVS